jgi:hypothetical protein
LLSTIGITYAAPMGASIISGERRARQTPRRVRRLAFVIVSLFCTPLSAGTVRLTGISVYSGDELGNPSGYETFADVGLRAQYWRTFVASGSFWYGLGVLPELPDDCTSSRPTRHTAATPGQRSAHGCACSSS